MQIDHEWCARQMVVLADTRAELALTEEEWARTYGMPHPGPSYTATMRAQEAYCVRELRARGYEAS